MHEGSQQRGVPDGRSAAPRPASPAAPGGLLGLQRRAGNRAVTALLQRAGEDRALVPVGAGSGPPAPRRGGDDLGRALEALGALAPILQVFVDALTTAMRQGRLRVTPAQGRVLLRLLVDLHATLGSGSGTAIPDGDPSPIPTSVSLAGLISFVLQTDVTAFVGANDLMIPASWLAEHPIDLTGLGLGTGTLANRSPAGLALLPGPSLDVDAILAMLRLPAWQYILRHVAHLPIALQVATATNGDLGWADDLVDYFLKALAAGLAPNDFAAALALAVGQGKANDWIPRSCLRNVGYDVTNATTLVNVMAGVPGLSDAELYKALQVFTSNPAHLAPWAAGLRNADTTKRRKQRQPKSVSPTSGAVAPLAGPGPQVAHPLEDLFGRPTFDLVRGAIVNHGRAYSASQLVEPARTMLGLRNNPAEIGGHLVGLCNVVDTDAAMTRACATLVELVRNRMPSAGISEFVTTHTGLVTGVDGMAPVMTALTHPDRAYTWNAATWTDLAALVNLLRAPPRNATPVAMAGLLASFPPTAGLTLARITQRLTANFDPATRNQTVPEVRQEFGQLEQQVLAPRLGQRTMCEEAAEWIRQAYRFMPCQTSVISEFLRNSAVKATLRSTDRKVSAAFFLLQFARYHNNMRVGPFAQVVNVAAGGAARPVSVTDWIINHILERHTFQGFALTAANIDRPGAEGGSTIFERPDDTATRAQLVALVSGLLGNAAVAAAYPWTGADPIQIGSYQMRLAWHGPSAAHRITQLYLAVAAGVTIPRAILHAIAAVSDGGGFA